MNNPISDKKSRPRGYRAPLRVIRGGDWYEIAYDVRTSHRNNYAPPTASELDTNSFRIVRNK